ncbi:MAG: hypothetical protein HYZ15_10645 [Sphingobacteriales bacterium]|nr:hypothetical protein [Sphingobacteriales bacterium]
MKRLLMVALLFAGLNGALSAQTTQPGTAVPGTNKNSSTYVDTNKNNVCDNYENRTRILAGKGQGRRAGYGWENRQKRCNLNTRGTCRRRA